MVTKRYISVSSTLMVVKEDMAEGMASSLDEVIRISEKAERHRSYGTMSWPSILNIAKEGARDDGQRQRAHEYMAKFCSDCAAPGTVTRLKEMQQYTDCL